MRHLAKISLISLLLLLTGSSLSLRAEVSDFAFRIGRSSLDSTYKYNSRAISAVSSLSQHPGGVVDIYSYSSPDGSLSRNRQLSRKRAESVKSYMQTVNPSFTYNMHIVDEDWDGVVSYLKHTKAEWAKDALEIVSTADVSKRKDLLKELWVGEAWDHLMKYCFPALRRVSVRFSSGETPTEYSGQKLKVLFGNSSFVPKLDSSTKRLLQDIINANPAVVNLTAFASPEGKESYNELLSLRRAHRLKEILIQYGCKSDIRIFYGGMDWAGLEREVSNSVTALDRDQVLEVLRGGYDNATMKKNLQRISYGRAWLHLMETEMTPLRRVEITF